MKWIEGRLNIPWVVVQLPWCCSAGALDVDEFVIIMDGSPSLRAVLQR